MKEELLSRSEWEKEYKKEQCALTHHAPIWHDQTLSDPVGTWACDCGQVTWNPS